MPLQYVPYEELPLADGIVDAGFLGQEIYGFGWTFRAWLLWEGYAVAGDREVVVVNTDSYREGGESLRFFVYNGTIREVATTVRFAVPTGALRDAAGAPLATVDGILPVTVEAGEWIRVEAMRAP